MIKNYLKEIEKLKSPISNEHTYRTPLENLLKRIEKDAVWCYSSIMQ